MATRLSHMGKILSLRMSAPCVLTPVCTMRSHAIPCVPMQSHAFPCVLMRSHAIPCDPMSTCVCTMCLDVRPDAPCVVSAPTVCTLTRHALCPLPLFAP
eukprot:366048-Chlamydomonas_euryale.AAC.11